MKKFEFVTTDIYRMQYIDISDIVIYRCHLLVVNSFTLQGGRGSWTAVYRFCGSLLFTCSKNFPSTIEDTQRWLK